MKGTWREGSLAGDPDGYVEKALGTGISFHRGPALGNLGQGSSTGDSKRWMEGAWWIKCLSLSLSLSLSEEAPWRGPGGELLHWRPWKIRSEGLQMRASLSVGAPMSPRGTRLGGRLVYRGL